MGKRILALCLTIMLSITIYPSGLSAADVIGERQNETELEAGIPSFGDARERNIIKISEEEARLLHDVCKEEQGECTRASQKYSVSWDKYSSNFIYNRLNKKEQQFWDAMDELCRSYLTTNKDAIHIAVSDDKDGFVRWCYIMDPVSYSVKDLKENRVYQLISWFLYANPQYYFVDGCFSGKDGTVWLMVYDAFGKGTNRKKSTAKMKKVIDDMEREIAKEKTDIEKARVAHDLIIQHVTYDALNQTPFEQSPYHQSAFSVFCRRSTVCTGYAMAFELLMNGAGVDTLVVLSKTHAWNMICLNHRWYHVDCTWDDKEGLNGKEAVYTYFNRSTEMLMQLDPDENHLMLLEYRDYVPKCTWDSGATENSIGTYEEPVAVSGQPKITQKKVSGGVMVSIQAADAGAEIYYTLDGKKPSSSFSRSNLYRKPFKVTGPTTVKAIAVCDGKWNSEISTKKIKGKRYTITFHTKGGSKIKSQQVFAYAKVQKPSAPRRAGYQFVGWYQEQEYKNAWDFGKKVTKNLDLYAKWRKQ